MKVTVDYVLETADLRKIEYTSPSEHKTAIHAGNENDRLQHYFRKSLSRVTEVINRFYKEGYSITPAHPETTDLLLYIWEKKFNDKEVIEAAKTLLEANIKGTNQFDDVSKSFTKLAERFKFEPQKLHSFADRTERKPSVLSEGSRAGQALKPHDPQKISENSR